MAKESDSWNVLCSLAVSSGGRAALTHLSTWAEEAVSTCWASCSCSSCSAEDRTARHCSGRRDMLSCLWAPSWKAESSGSGRCPSSQRSHRNRWVRGKRENENRGGGCSSTEGQRRRDTPLFLLLPLLSQSFLEQDSLWPPPSLFLFLSAAAVRALFAGCSQSQHNASS